MAKKKKKVLIAEDEYPIARVLQLRLGQAGYEVDHAINGQDAVDLIQKNDYDLFLMDLMMPKMNGFVVLEWLKSNKKEIPVIVLSNLGQQGDTDKAKNLGAVDFVIKSNMSLVQIIEMVDKFFKVKK